MNEETRAILESLQFLVSMQKPQSERYQEKQSEVMTKNYLLLNPIKEESIKEKTEENFKEEVRSKFGKRNQ